MDHVFAVRQACEICVANGKDEPCLIGVYFNFARHTREPYRKMGSPIGHVWWLTSDQLISFASRTGTI